MTLRISAKPSLLFTVLFVLLKAFGLIGWSWWWVFAPLWAPVAVELLVGLILILAGVFLN